MRTPADDPRYQPGNGHPRRPYPDSTRPSVLDEETVRQLDELLTLSGVTDVIEPLDHALPGPPGYPIRLVLLGLLCACRDMASTNLDDAFQTITFRTPEGVRDQLSIPTCDIDDQNAYNALYNRFERAWLRLCNLFDPARHQRHSRLTRAEGRRLANTWHASAESECVRTLTELTNRLLLAPVRIAFAKGLMANWQGDLSIDTTAVPTWARKGRGERASLEVSAGDHYKGGGGDKEFGYSASLLVAAHAEPRLAGRYIQLVLGAVLHSPEKHMGQHAAYLVELVTQLTGGMRGFIAGDGAYTKLYPENFHEPMRKLGYVPVLDLSKTQVRDRAEFTHQGAIVRAGRLFCPHTPRALLDLYPKIRAAKHETDRAPLREELALIEPYALVRKDTADERGNERYSCPAAKVNCPWADERLRRRGKAGQSVPLVIDLDAPRRQRTKQAAAKPTVHIPEGIPTDERPKCCTQSAVTLHADVMPRTHQELAWQTFSWAVAFQSLRSHIEGKNGRIKTTDVALHAREKRQPRGRVAQTLLVAIALTIHNIKEIERFQRARSESASAALQLAGDDVLPPHPTATWRLRPMLGLTPNQEERATAADSQPVGAARSP